MKKIPSKDSRDFVMMSMPISSQIGVGPPRPTSRRTKRSQRATPLAGWRGTVAVRHFHGGEANRMADRYGPTNPDWPYAIIENLYDQLGGYDDGATDSWDGDAPFGSLA